MARLLLLITVTVCLIFKSSAVISPMGVERSPSSQRRDIPACPSNCYCSMESLRCEIWPSSIPELSIPVRTKVISFYNWPSPEVNESFFKGIRELQWLRLSEGQLLKFPTFGVLQKLTFLDLSNNKISSLPAYAFQNATFITHLNVSGNYIREVSSDFLSDLHHLRALDISRNPSILQISPTFFNPVINLRFLDISSTNINDLPPDWFNSLQNLYFLNISHNNIPSIPLLHMAAVEIFDLSFNPLHKLPTLKWFLNLREVYISHTYISNLASTEINECNHLQILDISHSNLSNINEDILRKCHNLREINLSYNINLWRIEHGALAGLTNLSILHLNNCPKLYDLEDDLFNGLVNLRYLYMQESGVKILPFSLSKLHNLSFVNLEGTYLLCDCYAFWLPLLINKTDISLWKGINPLQCHNGVRRSLDDLGKHLHKLECAGVSSYTVSNQWTLAPWGQSALLECNVTGMPKPKIVWQTVDHRLMVFNKSMNDHPWLHHQIVEAISIAEAPTEGKYQVLQSGQLLVREVSRGDIGRYKCFAYNSVSNTSVVTFLGIQDTAFRAFVLESMLFGFACAALFLLVTLLAQFIKFVMERLGWECCCCKDRLSPKAKQIRELIESIETYKSAQLDRLKDNYNSQVVSIKDSCYQQMERLRESYAHQSKNLKDLCDYSTQQITGARDQYLDQVNKCRDYSINQMNRVRENYVFQRHRIRKFSGHQLLRLRETYKYQQKTLNKLLETLPDLYIQNCRTGSCQRTDSMIFEDEIDGLDIYYKVDFFDTQSSCSDYYTPASTLTRQSRGAKLNHSRTGSTTSEGTDYQEAHSWVLKPGSIRNDKAAPHQRFHNRSFSLAAPLTGVHRPLSSDGYQKGHQRSNSASAHPSPQHFQPTSPVMEENSDSVSILGSPPILHATRSCQTSPFKMPITNKLQNNINNLSKEPQLAGRIILNSTLSMCVPRIEKLGNNTAHLSRSEPIFVAVSDELKQGNLSEPIATHKNDLVKTLTKPSKASDQLICDSVPKIHEGDVDNCDKNKNIGKVSLETSM